MNADPVKDIQAQIQLLLDSDEVVDDAQHNFTVARAYLMNKFTFLGRVISAVTPIQTKGLGPKMAYDQWWRVYYDPECWIEYTPTECSALLMEQVEHLVSRHPDRTRSMLGFAPGDKTLTDDEQAKVKKISKCQCCAISGRDGWTRDNLPLQHIRPDKIALKNGSFMPKGKSFENYYRLYPDDDEDGDDGEDGDDDGGRGRDPGGCGGQAGEWGLGPGDGSNGAQDGLNEEQQEQVRQGAAQDIKEAEKGGRLTGTGYSGWIEWADDQFAPAKVPWQTLAASAIRQERMKQGADDYTWQRPHPMSWQLGDVILPSLVSYEWKAAAVLDQSGSMTNDDCVASLSEVEGLIRMCGAKCDAYIATCGEADAIHKDLSSMKRLLAGRHSGGTDLRPAMAQALEAGCDLLVVCTDGYTPWPDKAPPVGCVILLFGAHCAPGDCPSWATVVECDD